MTPKSNFLSKPYKSFYNLAITCLYIFISYHSFSVTCCKTSSVTRFPQEACFILSVFVYNIPLTWNIFWIPFWKNLYSFFRPSPDTTSLEGLPSFYGKSNYSVFIKVKSASIVDGTSHLNGWTTENYLSFTKFHSSKRWMGSSPLTVS